MDFKIRHREDEMMDDTSMSYENLRQVYADIGKANAVLGGNKDILMAFEKLVLKHPKEKYSILDVGCGDGEILRKLCLFFRSRNLKVSLVGIDLNENAIALAKASSEEFPEISYLKVDILNENLELPKADFVVTALTMHHIPEESIPIFLKQLDKIAHIGIVISDLQRSRLAYYLFRFFSVIFIKTKEAKNDGLVSIRSGFIKKELWHYSELLSEYQHSIQWKWAFRYVWAMHIKRPTTNE